MFFSGGKNENKQVFLFDSNLPLDDLCVGFSFFHPFLPLPLFFPPFTLSPLPPPTLGRVAILQPPLFVYV